jgi:hypothetical protein
MQTRASYINDRGRIICVRYLTQRGTSALRVGVLWTSAPRLIAQRSTTRRLATLAIVTRLHPAADWIADQDTPERHLPAKQRLLTAGYRESYSARFNASGCGTRRSFKVAKLKLDSAAGKFSVEKSTILRRRACLATTSRVCGNTDTRPIRCRQAITDGGAFAF